MTGNENDGQFCGKCRLALANSERELALAVLGLGGDVARAQWAIREQGTNPAAREVLKQARESGLRKLALGFALEHLPGSCDCVGQKHAPANENRRKPVATPLEDAVPASALPA